MNNMRTAITTLTLVALTLLASCTAKSEKPTTTADTTVTARVDTTRLMVMQIQRCSRLYTTEYRIHKIITHDDKVNMKGRVLSHDYDINLPLGKRKIAIPVDATVKAYIDFAGFSDTNVRRDSTHIEIVLPEPRIVLTSSRIDHKGIREYVALTRRNFSDEELSAYERQGRDAIIADVAQTDIIENARIGAANVLIPMIEQMGFSPENITISFSRDYKPRDIMKLIDRSTIENKQNAKVR